MGCFKSLKSVHHQVVIAKPIGFFYIKTQQLLLACFSSTYIRFKLACNSYENQFDKHHFSAIGIL